MKNAPKLFFILLFLLMQTELAFALDFPPPPGSTVPPGTPCSICDEPDLTQEYIEYCNTTCNAPLPANNSIDILMYVGLLFGTFVIFKKINHKKTPM